MISANELRVDNWVNHKKSWSYRQPESVLKDFYFKWSERDWYAIGECILFLDDIEPIPLLSEILAKCGFKKSVPDINIGESYWQGRFFDLYEVAGTPNTYQAKVGTRFLARLLTGVHDIQNLHFYHTGRELEVNL